MPEVIKKPKVEVKFRVTQNDIIDALWDEHKGKIENNPKGARKSTNRSRRKGPKGRNKQPETAHFIYEKTMED